MVSKVRTQSRFSFRVWIKRSAQPLPSGARTKAGELSMPRKASSFWKASDMYWLPWSWRTDRPRATSFEGCEVTPDALADWLQRLEARRSKRSMDADALGRA